jgi:hypothetical protein
MEGPKVRATKDQIKEFKDSILWKDIKCELSAWKTICRHEYSQVVNDCIDPKSNRSTASVQMHLGEINGREKAVNYMLSIPNMFLQLLEGDKDEPGRE